MTRRALAAVLCGALAGCIGGRATIPPGPVSAASFHVEPRPIEYRLRAGDRLTLMYMLNLERDISQEYRLEVNDEIRLTVQDRPDLTGPYLVVPDGWLHLPLIAPLRVRGLTIDAVRTAIAAAYEPVVPNAEVTVSLVRFNSRANGFITTLTQGGGSQGPIFDTMLSLDGKTMLPQVGNVHLAGMTLAEASATVEALYRQVLPGVSLTLRLASTRGQVVTVLGEVRKPGAFEVPGLVTLTEALGYAEGWIPTAYLDTVVVVQQRDRQIYVASFDLASDLLVATQVILAPGDFVWVPRTRITDLNLWVDQFIRRNIPVNVGLYRYLY